MPAALDLEIGDSATPGDISVTIRASLTAEPDQSISFVGFGPRLIISQETLKASACKMKGPLFPINAIVHTRPCPHVRNRNRPSRTGRGQLYSLALELLAGAGFERFVERAELFLMLVGLTALLIGGRQRVRAGLLSRMNVVAT